MILEKLHRTINNFNKTFNWRRFRRDALHLGESLLVFGVLYINVGKMGRGRFDRCDPAGASGSVFRRGRRAELPDRRGGARSSGDVLSPIPGAGSGQRALRRLR